MQKESETGLQDGRPLSMRQQVQQNRHNRLPHTRTSKPKHNRKRTHRLIRRTERKEKMERRTGGAQAMECESRTCRPSTDGCSTSACCCCSSFFASFQQSGAGRLVGSHWLAICERVSPGGRERRREKRETATGFFCSGDPRQACGYACVLVCVCRSTWLSHCVCSCDGVTGETGGENQSVKAAVRSSFTVASNHKPKSHSLLSPCQPAPFHFLSSPFS